LMFSSSPLKFHREQNTFKSFFLTIYEVSWTFEGTFEICQCGWNRHIADLAFPTASDPRERLVVTAISSAIKSAFKRDEDPSPHLRHTTSLRWVPHCHLPHMTLIHLCDDDCDHISVPSSILVFPVLYLAFLRPVFQCVCPYLHVSLVSVHNPN
jgi:hypothetical protein